MNALWNYVFTHAGALAKVFFAVAAVLFLAILANWLWPGLRRRDRHPAALDRRVDPTRWSGDSAAAASGLGRAPASSSVKRPEPARAEPSREARSPDLALRSDVLGLKERIDGIESYLIQRMERLESRIGQVELRFDLAASTDDGGSPWPTPDEGGRYDSTDVVEGTVLFDASFGAATAGGGLALRAANRVPVEIDGSSVALSQSIPPEAWLVPQGGGRAEVSLNAEVMLNAFALDRFALFFDLGDRREGFYETRQPAEVSWDDGRQRGSLITAGKAVAR